VSLGPLDAVAVSLGIYLLKKFKNGTNSGCGWCGSWTWPSAHEKVGRYQPPQGLMFDKRPVNMCLFQIADCYNRLINLKTTRTDIYLTHPTSRNKEKPVESAVLNWVLW
jgi:hypothetical protein